MHKSQNEQRANLTPPLNISTLFLRTNICLVIPGSKKNGKICKISGEKLVIFTANFVHKFAAKCGECGEII